jgi:hypothetical protein
MLKRELKVPVEVLESIARLLGEAVWTYSVRLGPRSLANGQASFTCGCTFTVYPSTRLEPGCLASGLRYCRRHKGDFDGWRAGVSDQVPHENGGERSGAQSDPVREEDAKQLQGAASPQLGLVLHRK